MTLAMHHTFVFPVRFPSATKMGGGNSVEELF